MKGLHFWKTGIVLQMEETHATVEWNISNLKLRIQVWGQKTTKYLRLIMETIEILLQGWYRVS
jgi:hypothetical protein